MYVTGGDYQRDCVRGDCCKCSGGSVLFADCPMEQKEILQWTNWTKEIRFLLN